MKARIVVFSQTGNTRKVAGHVREGILEAAPGCEVDLVELSEAADPEGTDLMGVGCPVFYYQEPFNVRAYLESLPEQGGRPWFVFCTHGAVMGITLESMARILEAKGARVIGAHHTYADAWVPFYPHPTLTTGHPQQQALDAARDFGRRMARCRKGLAEGNLSGTVPVPEVTEAWARDEAAMLSREFLGQVMPRLEINPETCTRCGECQDRCPVGGIDVGAEPPRIQDPCIYCWHCVNVCPEFAVEADWTPLLQMAPGNYARYTEALEAAAGRGEFAWRVEPESIDFANPFHAQRQRGEKSLPEGT